MLRWLNKVSTSTKVLKLGTEERSIASGASIMYLVELESGVVELKHPEDENTFEDFNEWIAGYNSYIANIYSDASKVKDKELVNEFVDIGRLMITHPAEIKIRKYLSEVKHTDSIMSEEIIDRVTDEIRDSLKKQFVDKSNNDLDCECQT